MVKSVQFNAQKFQEAYTGAIAAVMKRMVLPLFINLLQIEYKMASPTKKKWGEDVASKIVKGRIDINGLTVTGYVK
nr:MAG TPA: hypothetical protein [Caudoviricetes sp.]